MQFVELAHCGNNLCGSVHNGSLPVPIVIVHGFFSSNRIGPYRLYYLLADQLNQLGYTVYRMDFSSMGESTGDIFATTFDCHVSDLCAIIDYVLQQSKTLQVHIIAHCVGCCTCLEALKYKESKIKSVTFLSPFMPCPSNFKSLLGVYDYQSYLNNDSIWHKGMYCDKSFMDAGFHIRNPELLKIADAKSVMAFFSGDDELSPISESILWAKEFGVHYSIIPAANHNYLDTEARICLFKRLTERFKELAGYDYV